MSNWVYSGRITKDNVAKFHEEFDRGSSSNSGFFAEI